MSRNQEGKQCISNENESKVDKGQDPQRRGRIFIFLQGPSPGPSGRTDLTQLFLKEDLGITDTDGKDWLHQRRGSLHEKIIGGKLELCIKNCTCFLSNENA